MGDNVGVFRASGSPESVLVMKECFGIIGCGTMGGSDGLELQKDEQGPQ